MNFFFFPNQTLAGQGHIDLTEQDKAMAWLRLDSCSHQTLAHFTCHNFSHCWCQRHCPWHAVIRCHLMTMLVPSWWCDRGFQGRMTWALEQYRSQGKRCPLPSQHLASKSNLFQQLSLVLLETLLLLHLHSLLSQYLTDFTFFNLWSAYTQLGAKSSCRQQQHNT